MAGSHTGKEDMQDTGNTLSNTKPKDSSAKLIFGDSALCAQFLRGYVDIPLLKHVQAEDIEDVTVRFVHMFTEERNSDVVKKVRIKEQETPFYVISLIEHKSDVDYNVVMQIFRYMAFIWEDYEKEQERQHEGISKTKNFRYPPILPILFYDGIENWTAATRLHDRILLSDILEKYIPDYECMLLQLKEYSNEELMEKKDEISIMLMIDKLQDMAEFVNLGQEIDSEMLKDITKTSPEYLLGIMSQVVEGLLAKLNVPSEEIMTFTKQIKERRMGELFKHFKAYDVQAARQELQQERTELQQERTELQQERTELQQERTELQQGQAELQQGQMELQQGQMELQQGQMELQQRQEELRKAQEILQQKLKAVQQEREALHQEVRQKLQKEVGTELQESQENTIMKLIKFGKKHGISKGSIILDLKTQYSMDEAQAAEEVEMYWQA